MSAVNNSPMPLAALSVKQSRWRLAGEQESRKGTLLMPMLTAGSLFSRHLKVHVGARLPPSQNP